MSWPNAKLGDVAEFINGYAFKPKHWGNTGKKIIRIQNLTNATKPFNKTTIDVNEKFHVSRGDILVSWSATLDVFEWRDENALLNQHIFKIIPNRNIIDLSYFKFMLKSSITSLLKYTRGSTMKHVNRGDFLNAEFPLPPLETQKQIAAILEKADQLRKDCQQMEQELNSLAQSVFIEMFGDPVSNPMGWEIRSIIDILSTKPQIGTTKPSHADGVQKVVRVGELGARNINYQKCGAITLEGNQFERYKLAKGDFLLARAIGSRSHLGKASLFDSQELSYVYDSHVMRLRFNESIMTSEFFYELLKTNGGRALFLNSSSQTAVQFNINSKQISKINIPVPPLKIQNNYLLKLMKVVSLISKNNESLEEYENLFNALMQKAFKGELNLK